MRRLLRHLATVLLVMAAISWIGFSGRVGGEESAQPEEPAVSALDKQIVGFAAENETLDHVLDRLQRGEPDFVICLETRIARDPAGYPHRNVTVGPIESATLAEVLDAVTAATEPGDFYTWYESPIKKGVIHILPRDPKERFACLDVVIPRFNVEDANLYEAFQALFDQPELAGVNATLAYTGGLGQPVTLDLANVTVRDALTHIALAAKGGMGWTVGGYVREPPMPGFSFGRFGTALRPEELPYELRREMFGN
jgi:hypothetical protein